MDSSSKLKAQAWSKNLEDGTVMVGITDVAQRQLGDVIRVQLPVVGQHFDAGAVVGEVESVQSFIEIHMPLAGEVVAVNDDLLLVPEGINQDPYRIGWLFKLKP